MRPFVFGQRLQAKRCGGRSIQKSEFRIQNEEAVGSCRPSQKPLWPGSKVCLVRNCRMCKQFRCLMRVQRNPSRNPKPKELVEAKRIAALPLDIQRLHPSALPSDPSNLGHIDTYGSLPEFYIDKPFRCRDCGKEEIWRAADQKWYYEEAKGHIDATAVRCHDCRQARKTKGAAGEIGSK